MSLREQFEKWYKTHQYAVSLEAFKNGKYKSIGTQLAWDSFQAGHEAYQKQLQAEREAYQQHCDNRILRNRIQ